MHRAVVGKRLALGRTSRRRSLRKRSRSSLRMRRSVSGATCAWPRTSSACSNSMSRTRRWSSVLTTGISAGSSALMAKADGLAPCANTGAGIRQHRAALQRGHVSVTGRRGRTGICRRPRIGRHAGSAFAKAELDVAFLDLHEIEDDTPVGEWMSTAPPTRQIGWGYSYEDEMNQFTARARASCTKRSSTSERQAPQLRSAPLGQGT